VIGPGDTAVASDKLQRVVTWLVDHEFGGRSRTKFLCPGHADTNPSLVVSRGTRGDAAVAMKCFAGCDFQRILDAMTAIDGVHRWTLDDFSVGPVRGRRALPDLAGLEAAERRGDLHSVPVMLGDLPDDASADMRAVAEDFAKVRGLYLSAGEQRPTPYSARFCATRLGWDKMRAHRAIRALVAADVIATAGQLDSRGAHGRGTGLYVAPLGVRQDKPAPVAVEVAEREPTVEVVAHTRMDRAEPARRKVAVGVAAGDGTIAGDGPAASFTGSPLDVVVHGPNPTARAGVTWVGEGVVGRFVWTSVDDRGEAMPF
jgi:hypothetical protein